MQKIRANFSSKVKAYLSYEHFQLMLSPPRSQTPEKWTAEARFLLLRKRIKTILSNATF